MIHDRHQIRRSGIYGFVGTLCEVEPVFWIDFKKSAYSRKTTFQIRHDVLEENEMDLRWRKVLAENLEIGLVIAHLKHFSVFHKITKPAQLPHAPKRVWPCNAVAKQEMRIGPGRWLTQAEYQFRVRNLRGHQRSYGGSVVKVVGGAFPGELSRSAASKQVLILRRRIVPLHDWSTERGRSKMMGFLGIAGENLRVLRQVVEQGGGRAFRSATDDKVRFHEPRIMAGLIEVYNLRKYGEPSSDFEGGSSFCSPFDRPTDDFCEVANMSAVL